MKLQTNSETSGSYSKINFKHSFDRLEAGKPKESKTLESKTLESKTLESKTQEAKPHQSRRLVSRPKDQRRIQKQIKIADDAQNFVIQDFNTYGGEGACLPGQDGARGSAGKRRASKNRPATIEGARGFSQRSVLNDFQKSKGDRKARLNTATNDEYRIVESKIKELLTRGDVKNKIHRNNFEGSSPPQIYIGDFQIYNSYKSHHVSHIDDNSVIKKVNNFIHENYDQPEKKQSIPTISRGQRRPGLEPYYAMGSPVRTGPRSVYSQRMGNKSTNRLSDKTRLSIDKMCRKLEEENDQLMTRLQQQEVLIEDLSNPQNAALETIPQDEEGYKKSLQKIQVQSNANYTMLMRTKQQLQQSQKETIELRQQLTAFQRQMKQYNFESKENSLMTDQIGHINQQRSTIQKLEEENVRLKAANVQMEREIQSQNQQIDTLIRDQHRTVTNLNLEVLSEHKIDDIQVRQSTQKTDSLKKHLDELMDENHSLSMKLKKQTEDHQLSMMSFTDQLKEKETQIASLRTQIQQQQETIGQQKDHDLLAMTENLETYKMRLEAAVGKVEEYQQMVVKESNIGRNETIRADEAEKSLQCLQLQFTQMEEALTKQIRSYKDQQEIQIISIEMLKEQKADLATELQRAKNDLEDFRADEGKGLKLNQEELDTIRMRASQLEQETAAQRDQIEGLETSLQDQSDQIYNLQEELEQAQDQLKKATHELSLEQDRSTNLQLHLSQLEHHQSEQINTLNHTHQNEIQVKTELIQRLQREKEEVEGDLEVVRVERERLLAIVGQAAGVKMEYEDGETVVGNEQSRVTESNEKKINKSRSQLAMAQARSFQPIIGSSENTKTFQQQITKQDEKSQFGYISNSNTNNLKSENKVIHAEEIMKSKVFNQPSDSQTEACRDHPVVYEGQILNVDSLESERVNAICSQRTLSDANLFMLPQPKGMNPSHLFQVPEAFKIIKHEVETGNSDLIQELRLILKPMIDSEGKFEEIVNGECQDVNPDVTMDRVFGAQTKDDQELIQLQTELQNHKQQLQIAVSKQDESNQEIKMMRRKLDELEREVEEVRREKEMVVWEMEEQERQEKERQEKEEEKEIEVDYQRECEEKDLAIEELKGKLKKVKDSLEKARMENAAIDYHLQTIEDLRALLEDKDNEIKRLNEVIDTRGEQITGLNLKIEGDINKIKDIEGILESQDQEIFCIETTKLENKRIKDEFGVVQNKVKDFLMKMEEETNKLEILPPEFKPNNDLQEYEQCLQNCMTILEGLVSHITKKHQDLKALSQSFEDTKSNHQHAIETFTAQIDQLRKDKQEQEANMKIQEAHINELKMLQEKTVLQLNEANSKTIMLIEKEQEMNSKLSKENEKIAKQGHQKDQEIKHVKDQIKVAHQDVEWKADLALQADRKLRTLKECHQTEIEQFTQLLQEKDVRIKHLQQKLEKKEVNYIGEVGEVKYQRKLTPEKSSKKKQSEINSPVSVTHIQKINDQKSQEIIVQQEHRIQRQSQEINHLKDQLKKLQTHKTLQMSSQTKILPSQQFNKHDLLLARYQSLFSKEQSMKVNYKVVYQILSHYTDAEYSVNADSESTPEKIEKKAGPPTSKQELLEKIKDFLISEGNLKSVFEKFGKMHGNPEEWQMDETFLKPYRFHGKYIKLMLLIQDLFANLK